MKKYLLPDFKQYKANLHTHTNVSDGRHSPEEVKDFYKSHGYCIVAFTDHDMLVDHSYLSDKDFLAITGYEYGIDESGKEWKFTKTCHICFLSKDPHNVTHVAFNPKRTMRYSKDFYKTAKYHGELFEGSYSVENLNFILSEGKKHGFFVTVNHPWWSLMEVEELYQLENFDGMEVFNTASTQGDSYYELNFYLYDLMLRKGKMVLPIAADDMHGLKPENEWQTQALGGFNLISAPSLDYSDVMSALEKGDFYASTGPIIKSIYAENGEIVIECEPAKAIYFRTASRRGFFAHNADKSPITKASFPMVEDDIFVYASVRGFEGDWAYTRAYNAKEILENS